LLSEDRLYGGGLHKVGRKELAQVPAREMLDSVNGDIRIVQQIFA
jgi:hypothetical protein